MQQTQSERREATIEGAIVRLEENFAGLDARGSDPIVERRLADLEHGVSEFSNRLDARRTDPETEHRFANLEHRFSEVLSKLESRGADPEGEHRVANLERVYNEILARIDNFDPASPRLIEDALRN